RINREEVRVAVPIGNADIVLSGIGNHVWESASIFYDRSSPQRSRKLKDAPQQKPVRQIARKIGELVWANDRRGEGAEVMAEVVQIAPGAAAYVGEEALLFLAQPQASRDLELAVSPLTGPFQQIGASIRFTVRRSRIQNGQAVGIVAHVA